MRLIPVMKHEAKQMWVRFSNGRGRGCYNCLKIDNFETNSFDTLGIVEKTDGLLRFTVLPPNYASNPVRGSYVFLRTYENENILQKNGGKLCSEYAKPS